MRNINDFIPIEEYMKRTKPERQQHLLLNEPCIEIGGTSSRFRGLLAHSLGTTLPSGCKIHLCHACNNGKCSNPNHLYWGTAKENQDDSGIRDLARRARWDAYRKRHSG